MDYALIIVVCVWFTLILWKQPLLALYYTVAFGLFFKDLILIMCMWVPVKARDVGFPGTGIVSGCEPAGESELQCSGRVCTLISEPSLQFSAVAVSEFISLHFCFACLLPYCQHLLTSCLSITACISFNLLWSLSLWLVPQKFSLPASDYNLEVLLKK